MAGASKPAGAAKLHLGRYEEAVVWLRRAIEANRNNPLLHFLSGAALAGLGRFDDARSATNAGLALDPTFSVARIRTTWNAATDNSTLLAQHERSFETWPARRRNEQNASSRRSPPYFGREEHRAINRSSRLDRDDSWYDRFPLR